MSLIVPGSYGRITICWGSGAPTAAILDLDTKHVEFVKQAMAGVNKTMDVTPGQLKDIENGLIAISNKTGSAATDLAAIAEAGGAMGIAREDILGFTEVVAMLGQTTNVTTDEAATALGQLSNVIKLTGDEYDNFASALVDLGNKGASTEAQILEVTKRSGGAAAMFGLAKDETLAWAAAAANLGLNEELAGTALQNLFVRAMPAFMNAGKTMEDVTGRTASQIRQSFTKDAGGALESFLAKLGEMPKDARLEAIQKVFGKGSGLTRLILGLSDSMDLKTGLAASLGVSANAWKENTAATEEFAKRQATTQNMIDRLKQNVKNAAVTIGTNLLPMVNELASSMTDWISSHQPEIQQFGKDLAAGIKEAVKWAKSLNWDAIALALKAGATIESVMATIGDTADAVQQISSIAKQQSVGIQQVSIAMDNINAGMKQTTTSAESLQQVAEDFNALAMALRNVARKYKV